MHYCIVQIFPRGSSDERRSCCCVLGQLGNFWQRRWSLEGIRVGLQVRRCIHLAQACPRKSRTRCGRFAHRWPLTFSRILTALPRPLFNFVHTLFAALLLVLQYLLPQFQPCFLQTCIVMLRKRFRRQPNGHIRRVCWWRQRRQRIVYGNRARVEKPRVYGRRWLGVMEDLAGVLIDGLLGRLLRSHSDSARCLSYVPTFEVTRCMVIVLRLGIKAFQSTSGMEVSQIPSAMRWRAKRMPAARLTWRGGKAFPASALQNCRRRGSDNLWACREQFCRVHSQNGCCSTNMWLVGRKQKDLTATNSHRWKDDVRRSSCDSRPERPWPHGAGIAISHNDTSMSPPPAYNIPLKDNFGLRHHR